MHNNLSSLCSDFTYQLASSAPTPGGGGAAALCAALSAALCSMAGKLSEGKKSAEAFTEELSRRVSAAEKDAEVFLEFIDDDASAFEPLSRAYSIPKDAPEREILLSKASETAAQVPFSMLSRCLVAAENIDGMSRICSRLLLSDVGCAASLCRAAAECAAMNVYVNLPGIADADTARRFREKTDSMLEVCAKQAGELSRTVLTKLRG